MAKIFIDTHKPEDTFRTKRWFGNGFRTNHWSNRSIGCQTAEKFATGGCNLYRSEAGTVVATSGTAIGYSGHMGHELLRATAEQFDADSPLAVRKLLFGHYLIFVWSQGKGFVFCDPIASYYCFYRIKPDRLEVSNLLSEFLVDDDCEYETTRLIRAAFEGHAGLADKTFIKGVNRLRGNEWISISDSRNAKAHVKIQSDFSEFRDADPEEALTDYNSETDRVFSALRSIDSVGINTTGGLDSRLILAWSHRVGLSSHLLCGVGNSCMTNTRPRDRVIADKLSKHYGRSLTIMDWKGGVGNPDTRKRNFQKYGFAIPDRGQGELKDLEGGLQPYPLLHLGGYCPAFTNQKPWSYPQEKRNIDSIAEMSMRRLRNFIHATDDIDRSLRSDLSELAENINVHTSGGKLNRQGFVRLFYAAYQSVEALALNSYNQVQYYLAPLFISPIYEVLCSVPAEMRESDHFQVSAVLFADPCAFDVPVYSGLREAVIDINKREMTILDRRRTGFSRLVPSKRRIKKKLARFSSFVGLGSRVSFDQAIRNELEEAIRNKSKSFGFQVGSRKTDVRWMHDLAVILENVPDQKR